MTRYDGPTTTNEKAPEGAISQTLTHQPLMPEPQKGIEPLTAWERSQFPAPCTTDFPLRDGLAHPPQRYQTRAETQPAATTERQPDLAAICERHGIEWHEHCPCGCGRPCATDVQDIQYADSVADAICALLKARWGMTTRRLDAAEVIWQAYSVVTGIEMRHAGHTELAAVVALADRLAGVLP